MDKREALSYEAPRVVDYGDLRELTAACLGGSGGDAFGTPLEQSVSTPSVRATRQRDASPHPDRSNDDNPKYLRLGLCFKVGREGPTVNFL